MPLKRTTTTASNSYLYEEYRYGLLNYSCTRIIYRDDRPIHIENGAYTSLCHLHITWKHAIFTGFREICTYIENIIALSAAVCFYFLILRNHKLQKNLSLNEPGRRSILARSFQHTQYILDGLKVVKGGEKNKTSKMYIGEKNSPKSISILRIKPDQEESFSSKT